MMYLVRTEMMVGAGQAAGFEERQVEVVADPPLGVRGEIPAHAALFRV
jgi:hypothetical protein